jgi:N-acetylglucosamine kinase-like BadF-type ATPase
MPGHLKELPENTIWPHLMDAIRHEIEMDIRDYARSRQANVARKAETAALAATLVEKYAEGLAKALFIVGIDTNVTQMADALVREIDPDFEANKKARWNARPAGLLFPGI